MSEQTLRLTDAQRAGIERTDLSMAVTSGAGCGKTFVLARRYLTALTKDGRPDAPGHIVQHTPAQFAELHATMLPRRAPLSNDKGAPGAPVALPHCGGAAHFL